MEEVKVLHTGNVCLLSYVLQHINIIMNKIEEALKEIRHLNRFRVIMS